MNTPSPKRAVMLLTVAAFLSIGCTSLQNVPLSRGAQGTTRPDVKAGESVVVTKNDGTKRKFTVLKVEDDALVGHNVRINYADMAVTRSTARRPRPGQEGNDHRRCGVGRGGDRGGRRQQWRWWRRLLSAGVRPGARSALAPDAVRKQTTAARRRSRAPWPSSCRRSPPCRWRCGCCAPAPVEIASGSTPKMKASEVIRIGRRRSRAASSAASQRILALPLGAARRTRRSGSRSWPTGPSSSAGRPGSRRRSSSPRNDTASTAPSRPSGITSSTADGHRPALVQRGEAQEHDQQRQRVEQRRLAARQPLLIREPAPGDRRARAASRRALRCGPWRRPSCCPAPAAPWISYDAQAVEARQRWPAHCSHDVRRERGERRHRARRPSARTSCRGPRAAADTARRPARRRASRARDRRSR